MMEGLTDEEFDAMMSQAPNLFGDMRLEGGYSQQNGEGGFAPANHGGVNKVVRHITGGYNPKDKEKKDKEEEDSKNHVADDED